MDYSLALMVILIFYMFVTLVEGIPVKDLNYGRRSLFNDRDPSPGDLQLQQMQFLQTEESYSDFKLKNLFERNLQEPADETVQHLSEISNDKKLRNFQRTLRSDRRSMRHRRSYDEIHRIMSQELEVDETITNAHLAKCRWEDRHYCHNGGKCAYLAALDIKTCRCPMKYTGVRCEMIDLQYLLSTMNSFAFPQPWYG